MKILQYYYNYNSLKYVIILVDLYLCLPLILI